MAAEYGSFGDMTDPRVLARRLDESLHALDLPWPGQAPMRRAARWDGAIPALADFATGRPPDAGEASDLARFPRAARAENGLADRPFDIALGGQSPAGSAGRDRSGPLADLGVT